MRRNFIHEQQCTWQGMKNLPHVVAIRLAIHDFVDFLVGE
jgi:hypothetical protein